MKWKGLAMKGGFQQNLGNLEDLRLTDIDGLPKDQCHVTAYPWSAQNKLNHRIRMQMALAGGWGKDRGWGGTESAFIKRRYRWGRHETAPRIFCTAELHHTSEQHVWQVSCPVDSTLLRETQMFRNCRKIHTRSFQKTMLIRVFMHGLAFFYF